MARLHEWSWSGLPLVTVDQPNSGHWFETFADGFDLGSPEGVRVVRESLLLDGDDSVIERWGNRQITFQVAACGWSNADLADAERELAYRVGGQSVLSWVPPQSGAETWFLVRTSSMRLVSGNDLDLQWVQSGVRHQVYQVVADCAPFAMSPDLTTEVFTPGTASTSTLDSGTSAAAWPGMTTTTHLSLSAVQTPLLTATATPPPGAIGGTVGGHHWSTSQSTSASRVRPGVSGLIRYTGALGAVNFIYMDIAFSSSGASASLSGLSMEGTTANGSPEATQVLANGYTRYFWRKPTTSEVRVTASLTNMNVGETARFYVDQIGTSNLLPSGSMYGLSTIGSVRMPARLRIGSDAGTGETFLYADPSMVAYGWNPSNGDTYQFAPEGTYWVYVQPDLADYDVGDVFALTVAGQTKSTRTEWGGLATDGVERWFPIGPFHLGGRMSRRLGSVSGLDDSLTLAHNGSNIPGNPARLFRASEESGLLHVRAGTSAAYKYLFIDPASFDTPRPGVFAGSNADGIDATSALALTDSWAWPEIIPPFTAFWMQCGNTTAPSLRAVHRPLFHTFAAQEAA